MRVEFRDHFSDLSGGYAKYRPNYPHELFGFLSDVAPSDESAWDCATGNGQAAVSLAGFFQHVVATDASQSQIDAAMACPNVSYRTVPAEAPGLSDDSIDLVTVGQAFHWFNQAIFLDEVQRVLRPQGVLAIWCYQICSVNSACDAIVDRLYSDIVDEFWPPERAIVERRYEDLHLPGVAVDVPEFEMAQEWNVADQLGYLRTWSACKRYQAVHHSDPVDEIASDLETAWGPDRRRVVWPLTVRACRPNSLRIH